MDEEIESVDQDGDGDAFNDVFGERPTVTPDKPEPEEKPEPEPEVVEAPKYAQITEEQYQDLVKRASLIDEMKAVQDKSFGTAFGKIGGIERVLNQLQSTPSGVEVTADDFEELRAEFPELAEMQVKGLNKILGKFKGTGTPDIDKLVSQQVESLMPRLKIDIALDSVVGGDWVKERNSKAFMDWEQSQPAEVRQLAQSDELSDAKRMLQLYVDSKKAPVKPPVSTRKQQLEAAVTPKGTGRVQAPLNQNSEEAAQKAFDEQFKD